MMITSVSKLRCSFKPSAVNVGALKYKIKKRNMETMQKKLPGLEPRDVLIRLCVSVLSKVTSSSSSQ